MTEETKANKPENSVSKISLPKSVGALEELAKSFQLTLLQVQGRLASQFSQRPIALIFIFNSHLLMIPAQETDPLGSDGLFLFLR